jgi:hypothetical protein
MSRIGTGEQIKIAPKNNVYTVLAAVAAVVVILGLVMMIMRAKEVMAPGGIM